jgi:type I restriction enzyme R subunit
MGQHNEIAFETELCEHLAANGWLYSANDTGYDRQRALFPEDVFAWLEQTQQDELAKILKPGMSLAAIEKAKNALLDRLAKVLNQSEPSGGTLFVLRRGFQHVPASFSMLQKKPELTGNETTEARYAANRVRVMRQVHYSTKNQKSLDLVLFINGIPAATVELKTDFTQNVRDAINQYRLDRKPAGEPLLAFGRTVVHFAVSNDEVWMTTKLAGEDTRFLPFNRGNNGHAGNAPDPSGLTSPTAYLWEEVWQHERWLEIISKYVHYETVRSEDPVTGKKHKQYSLIFPRYHQLDVVTKLLDDVVQNGPGQRYLIQHSAGSGKTRSIAWSAHRLATLHTPDNEKVFDSVIVVTDRNVLDAQLQEAIKQIEAKEGFVATIDRREAAKRSFTSKSKYLTATLRSGKAIIVVTIQTFPHVLKALIENKELQDRKFAVIADEAHSSQAGDFKDGLIKVLTGADPVARAKTLADEEGVEPDIADILAETAAAKAMTPNISFFAYTATPKPKTLETFGTRYDEGDVPRPFHVYTMQQAIEEGFILDVLANYTTYKTAFQLAERVKGGQMRPLRVVDDRGELVDEAATVKGVLKWVRLHPTNIAQKVAFIVEHFHTHVAPLLDGTAKAMVVTDSRKAAIRYKVAMDNYIAKHNRPEVTSLVAFSGEVEFKVDDLDSYAGDPVALGKYTEASMNPGVGDLRKAFDTAEYRVMIVANKFQTGFDQAKLCAMYVDKRLDGVAAVQTLSRLNRFLPGKTTRIVDFVNNAEDILAAFKPFFAEATLSGTTDPNLIHDLGNRLDTAGIYTGADIDAVVEAFVLGKGNNAITGAIAPVKAVFISRYNAAVAAQDKATVDELDIFRKNVSQYVRLYDFLSQIVDLGSTDVAKRAIFMRLLAPQIRRQERSPEVDVSQVELVRIEQQEVGREQKLDLASGEVVELDPITSVGTGVVRDRRMALLSQIIERLNEQFAGEGFRDDQTVSYLEGRVAAMKTDESLVEQAMVNTLEQFLASPTLRDAAILAAYETDFAHGRMTELFRQNKVTEDMIIDALGRLFYLDLNEDAG